MADTQSAPILAAVFRRPLRAEVATTASVNGQVASADRTERTHRPHSFVAFRRCDLRKRADASGRSMAIPRGPTPLEPLARLARPAAANRFALGAVFSAGDDGTPQRIVSVFRLGELVGAGSMVVYWSVR